MKWFILTWSLYVVVVVVVARKICHIKWISLLQVKHKNALVCDALYFVIMIQIDTYGRTCVKGV